MKNEKEIQMKQQIHHDRRQCLKVPVIKMFELISSKKWLQLKLAMKTNYGLLSKATVQQCSGFCSHGCNSNHSLLHYVCQFNPPYEVVRILYKAYPEAVYETDCKDRYVLHIACKHGCSPKIVKLLLKCNPEAATKYDVKKRTPFIHTLKSYVRRSGNMGRKSANWDLIEVLYELNKFDKISVITEDSNGLSALEYAINEELSISVVKFVQYLAETKQKELYRERILLENEVRRLSVKNRTLFNLAALCGKQKCDLPSKENLNGRDQKTLQATSKAFIPIIDLERKNHRAVAA